MVRAVHVYNHYLTLSPGLSSCVSVASAGDRDSTIHRAIINERAIVYGASVLLLYRLEWYLVALGVYNATVMS